MEQSVLDINVTGCTNSLENTLDIWQGFGLTNHIQQLVQYLAFIIKLFAKCGLEHNMTTVYK